MRLFKWGIIAVCVLGATGFGQVRCYAQLIAGDNFAVLAQPGGAVLLNSAWPRVLGETFIDGNVGIGSGGLFSANGGTLDGNLTFADTQAKVTSDNNYNPTGSFHVIGTVNYGNPGFSVTNALSAADKASITIGGYTATQTFSGISVQPGQTKTIIGLSGINVININGNLNINGGQLKFQGPADAVFYVNVSGQVSIDGGLGGILSGSLFPVAIASENPGNVLLNLTGNGDFFGIVGKTLVEASVLNVNGNSQIGIVDSALDGQIVSDTIEISDSQILTPEGKSLTPEGSSLAMFLLGTLPILGIAIKRRSQRGSA